MNLTTATPAEIDAALAEIYGRFNKVRAAVAKAESAIAEAQGMLDPKSKFYRAGANADHYGARLETLAVKRNGLLAQAAAIIAETTPYDAEFDRRGGWSRFFLVTSSNGHIHRSQACSTCTPTTEFGWLPEVSGKTEAEAVAAHGALLCTVCYPSAPVEWTIGKAAPADRCPGSLTFDYPRETARLGFYSGNYGECSHCGTRQTVTSGRKLRTHKKA